MSKVANLTAQGVIDEPNAIVFDYRFIPTHQQVKAAVLLLQQAI